MPYMIKARMKHKTKGRWAPFQQAIKKSSAQTRAKAFKKKYPRMNFKIQQVKKMIRRGSGGKVMAELSGMHYRAGERPYGSVSGGKAKGRGRK